MKTYRRNGNVGGQVVGVQFSCQYVEHCGHLNCSENRRCARANALLDLCVHELELSPIENHGEILIVSLLDRTLRSAAGHLDFRVQCA